MAEYIEREATCGDCIHADVCEEAETLIGFSRENKAYCGMFLNSADVAPVRHGRWEPIGEHYENCTHCGCVFEALLSQYSFEMNNKFCRMCGTKMDLE